MDIIIEVDIVSEFLNEVAKCIADLCGTFD